MGWHRTRSFVVSLVFGCRADVRKVAWYGFGAVGSLSGKRPRVPRGNGEWDNRRPCSRPRVPASVLAAARDGRKQVRRARSTRAHARRLRLPRGAWPAHGSRNGRAAHRTADTCPRPALHAGDGGLGGRAVAGGGDAAWRIPVL